MNNNLKNIVVTVCFCVVIFGIALANIIMPDTKISYSERRTLKQVPPYTTKELLSGELFEDYEKYFLDQFIFRDTLRGFKAFTRFNIFKQKDNNDIYIVDGFINKMEYPLNEKAILNAANKLNEINEKYLQGMNVSYSIIPDKNYFVAAENGYLSMDYNKLVEIMEQNVLNMNYIDIFQNLNIEDYYRTDIHWNQNKIVDIAELLLREIDKDVNLSEVHYQEKSLYPFYGSYYGQAALKIDPDTLVYLTNDLIENASVYDHIDETYHKVYLEDKFGTVDSYDIFLSGAKSLLTITNPAADTNKELVIFRDSFGSSIAPLLLHEYSKITLVDLRYFATNLLGDYLDFSRNQDVLFIYNTLILNNSYMLK
ncbi:MAG TPA: DHHW family protein [Mobilitalea sp.]|nr:DHHW family protein [Mobilitalea sp.]